MIHGVLIGLLLAGARPARGESEFLSDLHKAESRGEAAERLEYASRALRAWKSSDGNTLLADAHYRRGEALAELYRFAEAEPELSDALGLDSGIAKAYLWRGRARLRIGRPVTAGDDFKAYAAFAPSDVEGPLGLAEARRKGAQYEQARRALERAATLDPSDFRVPLERGRLWAAQKIWDKAVSEFGAADGLANGGSAEALAARAAARAELGQTERALSDYDKAVPLLDKRLLELGRSEAPAPKIADAQEEAASVYYGRGRANEMLVRLEAALSDYREACKLGHKPACSKAAALSAEPEAAAPAKRRPPAAPKPAAKKPAKPKKKRLPKVKSEPGERFYGS